MPTPMNYDEAIRYLYSGLSKLKDEVDSQQIILSRIHRPWYQDSTVLISALAFAFSLGTTVFSYYQAQQQQIHNLRTEVRSALLQYNELAIDTLKSEEQYKNDARFAALISDKAGGTLGMLAIRISELAMEIPDHISAGEHLAIATTLHSADQSQLSERHTEIALKRSSEPQERVQALRLSAVYSSEANDLAKMRNQFGSALEEANSIRPSHLGVWSRVGTLQVWIARELQHKQCDEFSKLQKLAEAELQKLPSDLRSRKVGEITLLRGQLCQS